MKITTPTRAVFAALLILALLAGCVPSPLVLKIEEAQPQQLPESRALGDSNFTNIVTSGDATIGGDLTVNGTSTVTANPTTLDIGGGFSGGSGSITGCSFTAAGLLYCDGAIYTRSTLGVTGAVTTTTTAAIGGQLSAPSAAIGGGWSVGGGGSGCTLSEAGGIGCDGTAYFGSTLGVTGAVTVTGNTDLSGTLQYGANDLYPVGHASSGKSIVAATVSTAGSGHATITHGLSSVDSVTVSLCQAPATAAAFASAIITGTTVTLNAWDSTLSNRVNGVSLCYAIIGTK